MRNETLATRAYHGNDVKVSRHWLSYHKNFRKKFIVQSHNWKNPRVRLMNSNEIREIFVPLDIFAYLELNEEKIH